LPTWKPDPISLRTSGTDPDEQPGKVGTSVMGLESEEEEPRAPFPPPAGGPSSGREWLWTPWRMRYVAGADRQEGCIFCNRLGEEDDVQSLILHRGERTFVIMNLYPYNTGHLMIVPNAHIASPEDAEPEVMREMAELRGPVLRALRRALSSDGFNLGLNVGATAGAGVTDHLHEHVVPRWQGDANFMPILASTMVMPELIPVTYAKVRAELAAELAPGNQATDLVIVDDRMHALIDGTGRLPRVEPRRDEPIWRAAIRDARERGATEAELLGWAGGHHAGSRRSALFLRAAFPVDTALAPGNRLTPVNELADGNDAALVRNALGYEEQLKT
jgi:ATP adenylyltransferase